MIANNHLKLVRNILIGTAVSLCLFGIFMRFYHIAYNDFIYYDEGYYLNFNRHFYDILVANYPDNFSDMLKAFSFWGRLSLGTGKALWFLLVDMRVFFGLYTSWFYPRILAAVAGTLTLGLIFLFAKRIYSSTRVGILSMVLLAILPGHVFYSRLAMQETFSTLCFLSGFYFYLFPRKFGYRTFLSATFFAAAWFTNYRLITLPVQIAFCELFLSIVEKRMPDFRKYIWNIVTFCAYIFLIGAIDNAQNTVVVFAWIFYQSNLAKEQFDWFNFMSFPYYLFRLENFFYGLLFFGNIYYAIRRKWIKLLPFALACLYMSIYSFSAEKGARYLCVITPFITMSVAALIVSVFEEHPKKFLRVGIGVVALALISGMLCKSVKIYRARSDYRTVMEFLMERDPDIKLIATQNFVLNLYTPDRKSVVAFPYKFRKIMQLYSQGYKYILVCPQAYVSWPKDMKRFRPELVGFLNFIVTSIPPIKTFDHFDDVILERFVFDHNENLKRSLDFLSSSRKKHYGELRIYDIGQILAVVNRVVGIKSIKLNPEYTPDRPSDKYGR